MSENKDRIAQKTFAICTVTMSFNAIEDRIVMDSLDQSKKVERLWLSRRLLDRLIPHPHNPIQYHKACLLYTSPSPRDRTRARMPSSA